MPLVIAIVTLLTFAAACTICWRRGITPKQFFATETRSWLILWSVVVALMTISSFLYLFFLFVQNQRIELLGLSLMSYVMAIYCLFVLARCVHFVVRK
jgi:hypothetical protein